MAIEDSVGAKYEICQITMNSETEKDLKVC